MINQLLSSFFQILIPLIFSLFFVIKIDKKTILNFVLILSFFLIMSLVLYLPFEFESLNFTNTSWNFSGKIYSIIFSILFFYLFKNGFKKYNYVNIKQEQNSFKKTIPVLIVLILLGVLDGIQRHSNLPDNEKLIYQLLMPGIDEELAYRGVLLGLFSTILIQKIKVFSIQINPSILVVAILFGLIHGLKITSDLNVIFNSYGFCKTFIYGCFWGWITVKTKSVLLPIIFHNYANFIPNLISFLK